MNNKQEGSKTKYYVQWDTHAKHITTLFCSLMEHQSLVDLAISCGTNTIHAHKCILAANSPYFREQLEKNAGTEQVVITGLDFTVVKSIIEFMYCGETYILNDSLKYVIAAAKFFQMRALQTLVSDHEDIRFEADSIHIPPPAFLPKKPKYPNAYRPLNNTMPPSNFNSFKNSVPSDPYVHRKIKRKFVRSEAEKACAKEAAASRLALEALQKELASTSQMSSFVIEESCTETTVENFIPHTEESYTIENLNHIESVPLQVVNYNDLSNSILTTNQMITIDKSECGNNILPYNIETNSTKDKLKSMLGSDIPGNVEIMFRTTDGSFVNVTDDVLQNLSEGTLQYQIIDENGQVGEIRDIELQEQNIPSKNYEESESVCLMESSITEQQSDAEQFANNQSDDFAPHSGLDLSENLHENINNSHTNRVVDTKLEIVDVSQIIDMTDSENMDQAGLVNNSYINTNVNSISSSSSSSSLEKSSNDSSPSDSDIDEMNPLADKANKSLKPKEQADDKDPIEDCNIISQFVNSDNTEKQDKEIVYIGCETSTMLSKERNNKFLIKGSILDVPKQENIDTDTDLFDMQCDENISDSDSHSDHLDQNTCGSDDGNIILKKPKISQTIKLPGDENMHYQMANLQNIGIYSLRKTRSAFKMNEDNSQNILSQQKEEIENNLVCHVKGDTPRRIMPNRKKKSRTSI